MSKAVTSRANGTSASEFVKAARAKLIELGFSELRKPASLPGPFGTILKFWKGTTGSTKTGELLIFPNLDKIHKLTARMAIRLVAVVYHAAISVDQLAKFAESVHTNSESLLNEFENVSVTALKIYVVFDRPLDLIEQSQFKQLKRRHTVKRQGLYKSKGVCTEFAAIDTSTGTTKGTSKLAFVDQAIIDALAQFSKKNEPEQSDGVLAYARLILKKSSDMMKDYWKYMSLLNQLDVVAIRIIDHEYKVKDLFSAVTVSFVVATVFSQITGIKTGVFRTGLSIFNQTLDGFLLLLVYLVSAFIVHFPLRFLRGKADFHSTFLATAFVSAAFYPISLLMVAAFKIVGIPEDEAWKAVQASGSGLAAIVLGMVHQISMTRAALAVLVLPAIVALLLFGIIIAIF